MSRPLTPAKKIVALTRPWLVGLAVGTGLLTGAIPHFNLPGQHHVSIQAAYAQNPPSSEEIAKYARAVLQMEPHRRRAAEEIRRAGGNTNILCSDVFSGLPGGEVAARYCERAARIIEGNGLSSRRFNEITQLANRNEQIQSQIQSQMAQLCRQSEFQGTCR
jgi:hypothetical protein